MTEGLLLAIAGAGCGLVLASWATGALARSLAGVLPLGIAFQPTPDWRVVIATTALAVLATVLSGLGPALRLSKTDLVSDLKALTADGSPRLGRRFSARNVMVVSQIALSLMLLSAGGLFARGALKAAAANPGFSYDRQLLIATDPALVQYDEPRGRTAYREVLARVRVGLYGVKSYLVSQRTREIGSRMALGARPGDVMAMVLKEGAALSAVGVALGLPLAAMLGMAVSNLLYDVQPLDPVVILSAPALLALAALIATWLPARRATRVTPLTALRAD